MRARARAAPPRSAAARSRRRPTPPTCVPGRGGGSPVAQRSARGAGSSASGWPSLRRRLRWWWRTTASSASPMAASTRPMGTGVPSRRRMLEVQHLLAALQPERVVHPDARGVDAGAAVDRAVAVVGPDVVVARAGVDGGRAVARVDVVVARRRRSGRRAGAPLLFDGSQSPQRMSLPAPPTRWSEPWWPSSSSLASPPVLSWSLLSRTFQSTPVTAGQPACVTFAPPPEVWRPLPGPHCSPALAGAQMAAASPSDRCPAAWTATGAAASEQGRRGEEGVELGGHGHQHRGARARAHIGDSPGLRPGCGQPPPRGSARRARSTAGPSGRSTSPTPPPRR